MSEVKNTTVGGVIPRNGKGEVRKTWTVSGGGEAKKVAANPTGTRKPTHPDRRERRATADEVLAARRLKTDGQQLAELDARFGKGLGAAKERCRLLGFNGEEGSRIRDYCLRKNVASKLETPDDVRALLKKIERGG
jgi:hypothetical protein